MRREFSKLVRRDAFARANGQCEGCSARLTVGKFHYDHSTPDGLGGEPTLENCVVLCVPCHREKTSKRDVPAIAKSKRVRDREIGIRTRSRFQSRGFPKAKEQRTASRPIERRTEA